MPRITISYRRDDSLDITGRIFDRLAAHFGREAVFRDIDNIPPGVDFRRHIDRVLEESDIILAIVGPRWIGPENGERRLTSPADPVRLEVEAALRMDKPLIPVLVSRAAMPHPEELPDSLQDFAYRNAMQVDSGQDFDVHITRLVRAMERIDEERAANKPAQSARVTVEAARTIAPLLAPEPPGETIAPAPRPIPAPVSRSPRLAIVLGIVAVLVLAVSASWWSFVKEPAEMARREPAAAGNARAEEQSRQAAAEKAQQDEAARQAVAAKAQQEEQKHQQTAAAPPTTAPPTTAPKAEPAPAIKPFSERPIAIQYPGFGGAAQAPPSSAADIQRQLGRFAAAFEKLRGGGSASDGGKLLKLFNDCFNRISQDFVVPVSAERLVDAALGGLEQAKTRGNQIDEELIGDAINGMLTAIDPHSNYLNRKNFADMKVQTRGEFGGLGIEVSMEHGLIKVVSPLDDTPAARAGLKPSDLITQLDGAPVQGITLPEAVQKMRGPIDTPVTLRIQREGADPFDVRLVRAKITTQPARWHLEGKDVGYIRITTFNEQTHISLTNAMQSLKKQAGNKLAGIVLDLRNNPGGLLDQAIAVADDFLDKGEIVSLRGRHPSEDKRYDAHPGDIASGLPVVVLINKGTAAGTEILVGALQDNHRATIVGTPSFGKGSLQTIVPLPDDQGAMRLTTALWFTPSGRAIQGTGISPDQVVEAGNTTQVATAAATFGGSDDQQYRAAVALVRSLAQRH